MAQYKATGTDRKGKRFRITSDNYSYIMCINMWKGNVSEKINGKWKRIKSVSN